MKALAATPFFAVFRTEVLLNAKRVTPYAMLALFSGNALLWWGWGPAGGHGWATNSDFFVARSLAGFSFMTLPFFTAVIMGDPVARDFRAGVAPLILSKPLGHGAYLAGKFFGNFFVLVCCQAAFPATFALLQMFRRPGMLTQPARLLPYAEHFLAVVVVTHLVLAAFYFAVGTLTRNAKIVYALAASFYPLYLAYQTVVLRGLPTRWRVALDPLLMNWADVPAKSPGGGWLDAGTINRLAYSYDADVLANRALMLLSAAALLALVRRRFSTDERAERRAADKGPTAIGLGAGDETLFRGETSPGVAPSVPARGVGASSAPAAVALPEVRTLAGGARAGLRQLCAAAGVELRLLFAERSLLVLLPLSTLASVAGLVYFEAAPEPSYSASYAARTADSFVLFMAAISLFYTGESMHRDRELRIEPVLWSTPAPNFALLVSKFVTTFVLTAAAAVLVAMTAAALQLYKGHAPFEPLAYLKTYSVILMPGAAFMIAAALLFNVVLRDKYLAYAVCLATGGGLFYLYNLGLNHPLYNPLLYSLWTPADLDAAAGRLPQLLTHRLYCLALAALCLSLAHLLFARAPGRAPRAGAYLRGRGWALMLTALSATAAIITGLLLGAAR